MTALRMLASAALTVAALLSLAAPAVAEHSVLEHISVGPNGWNAPENASALAVSHDGRSIVLRTDEQLVAEDTDAMPDLYLRAGGATYLVSGPSVGYAIDTPDSYPTDVSISADGSRVVFTSRDGLTPDDADESNDVYLWSSGALTRVSTGSSGGNAAESAGGARASADATRIFFHTEEQLTPDDSDQSYDVYSWRNGTASRMAGIGFTSKLAFSKPSADRLFFQTPLSMAPEDTDGVRLDYYEATESGPQLVSIGATGGSGFVDATDLGISEDGTHAVFKTAESLVSDDTDTAADLYERFGGTTRLASTGPAGGNGAFDVNANEQFDLAGPAGHRGISADGSRIFFFTSESLVAADTDTKRDVYMRSGTTTTLVSVGPAGGNGPHDATGITGFQQPGTAISRDGTHAYFTTLEQLTFDDTDTDVDLYEWADGIVTAVSPPCLDGPSCGSGTGIRSPSFIDVSRDGSRVFFATAERIDPTLDATHYRLFEKHQGTVSDIPGFPQGWAQAVQALFTPDGRHVVFGTVTSLRPSDTDSSFDVYEASVASAGYPRPIAAPIQLVSLVPAYVQCSTPDREHGPPLAFGSCAPPQQTSQHLTVGTADANGAAANSSGVAQFGVMLGDPSTPADEADVRVQASVTDVRVAGDLSDYTGELEVVATLRQTDRFNAAPGGGTDAGTMIDIELPVRFPCAATASGAIGSNCAVDTTIDAIAPGAVKERKRSIWEHGQIRVYDGGADGDAQTGPDDLFMVQGLFVP